MKPELTAQILGMYLGRPCHIEDPLPDFSNDHNGIITPANITGHISGDCVVVPHLRRFESITEEECRELYLSAIGTEWDREYECKRWLDFDDDYGFGSQLGWCVGNPSAWLYLLSKGFDLFGLIDANLANEVSE